METNPFDHFDDAFPDDAFPDDLYPDGEHEPGSGDRGFTEARRRAEQAEADPDEMKRLLDEAAERVGANSNGSGGPAQPENAFVATFLALVRLIRAAMAGAYDAPRHVIAVAVIAVAYVAVTVDAIPDFLPVIGLLDDAVVVGISGKMILRELDRFRRWETMTR